MRRLSIGRLIAVAFLATIVLLLSIDTTQACRFFRRHRLAACPPVVCAPVVVYQASTYSPCWEPAVCEVSTCSPCPAPVCGVSTCAPCPAPVCCGETLAGDVLIEGPVVDGGVVTEDCEPIVEPYPSGTNDWQPAEPTPAEAEATDDVVPAEAESPVDTVEPALDEPVLLPDADDESAVTPLLDDTLPEVDAAPEMDALPDVDTVPDADVLPGTDTAPGADAVPDTTPADDSLDIFDAPPAADTAPTLDSLPDATPEESLDDIFAEPPAAETSAPAVEETPPADLPAEEPTDDLDDLFSEATDTSADGEPRMATNPGEAATDDLFGDLNPEAPADQPAAAEAPDAADDLFSPAPAEGNPTPSQQNDTTDLDDLFGQRPAGDRNEIRDPSSATTRVTKSQTARLPFRVWTDNTGNFQTAGRLVQVGQTHIRLLKDNGRYSTVSKTRLSQADLAYVDQMVKQLGLQIVDQLARR